MRIYMDYNATAPVAAPVRAAIADALAVLGNPSSIHTEGRAARDVCERARAEVAALVGGAPDEIAFTSGGTEADSLGLIGLARAARAAGRPPRVLTAPIEHPAVLGAAAHLRSEGFEIVEIAVNSDGLVDPDAIREAAADGAAAVAVALANHELGTVQDISAIAAAARECGALMLCDAVQAAGKRALDVAALGCDAVAISAHKFSGPAGVGALWIRRGVDVGAVIDAGHHERGRRPGTENLLGIAGMGAAAAYALERGPAQAARVAALARTLEDGLRALPGAVIHGSGAPRIGNTVNARFAGALGETLVVALDLAGFAVSTGAACTSGTVAPSPVLLAVGIPPERAVEAVRFSLGPENCPEDIQSLLEIFPSILLKAKKFR